MTTMTNGEIIKAIGFREICARKGRKNSAKKVCRKLNTVENND
jgi:hypothetical protein